MRVTPMVVLAAAVVLSGACTGPAAQSPPVGAFPASTPTATAEPYPIFRYASSLQDPIKAMRETLLTYAVDGCLFEAGSNSVCTRGQMTLNAQAKTLVAQIHSADDPHSARYIGPPPADLVTLIAETKAAAQQVDDDIDDNTHKLLTDTVGWLRDVRSLINAFDRWNPYL